MPCRAFPLAATLLPVRPDPASSGRQATQTYSRDPPAKESMATRRRRATQSLATKAAELALAVPQVVAHRVTRMALSGPKLSPRDRKEFNLMVAEKNSAFGESWNAMAAQAALANQALAASFFRSFLAVARGKKPSAGGVGDSASQGGAGHPRQGPRAGASQGGGKRQTPGSHEASLSASRPTLPSSGRPPACVTGLRLPLMSDVARHLECSGSPDES